MLTFRLADSLPGAVLASWREELAALPPDELQLEWERRIATYLDAGHRQCLLRQEGVARLVEDTLLHFDGVRYHLLAGCVMPNHVHVVAEMAAGYLLFEVVHSWKSYTAGTANRLLGRRGAFWTREYHDRFIRDRDHLANAIRYMEHNPVSAGLASHPEAWPYSSAAAAPHPPP